MFGHSGSSGTLVFVAHRHHDNGVPVALRRCDHLVPEQGVPAVGVVVVQRDDDDVAASPRSSRCGSSRLPGTFGARRWPFSEGRGLLEGPNRPAYGIECPRTRRPPRSQRL